MRDEGEQELESTLSEIGQRLDYPRRDLWPSVRDRIAARRNRRWWIGVVAQPLVPVAATLLVIVVAVFALTPSLVTDAERILGVRGVQIFPVKESPSPAPSPLATPTFPGQRAPSLADASTQAGFIVRAPAALGAPDDIYVEAAPARVTLVYRTVGAGQRSGIPESPVVAGVSAVVVELKGSIEPNLLGKVVGPGTTIENVTVNGTPGVWLAGQPHQVFYRESSGNIQQETLRLAGDTLLWDEGDITFRLEAQVSRDDALRIAATFR